MLCLHCNKWKRWGFTYVPSSTTCKTYSPSLRSLYIFGLDDALLDSPSYQQMASKRLKEAMVRILTTDVLPQLRQIVFINSDPGTLVHAIRFSGDLAWWKESLEVCKIKGIALVCHLMYDKVSAVFNLDYF